jgi:poly-D-alanine transfer protein DltD
MNIQKKDPDDRVLDWNELEPLVRQTRAVTLKNLLRVHEYVWKEKTKNAESKADRLW